MPDGDVLTLDDVVPMMIMLARAIARCVCRRLCAINCGRHARTRRYATVLAEDIARAATVLTITIKYTTAQRVHIRTLLHKYARRPAECALRECV